MKFRVIYQIEVISKDGELVARTYARNKHVAERICRRYARKNENSYIIPRKMNEYEKMFVNPSWVEV